MADSQEREIFSSQKGFSPAVFPGYVRKHGVLPINQKQHVLREICFALTFEDNDGVEANFCSTAKRWNNHRYDVSTYDYFWAFQLMATAVEAQLGALKIKVDPNSARYRRVIAAMARLANGTQQSTDAKLVARSVEKSHYIDLQQQKDIRKAAEDEKKLADKRRLAKLRKLENELAIEAPAEESDEEEFPPLAMCFVITRDDEVVQPGKPLEGTVFQTYTKAQLTFYTEDRENDIVEMDAEENQNSDNFDDVLSSDHLRFLNRATEERGSKTLPKVVPTVTPIPHKDDPNKVAVVFVRFLIHDPLWNAGKIVYKLMDDAEARQNNVNNRNFNDPWEHYVSFSKGLHPVHNISWAKYVQCFLSVTNTQAHGRELDDLTGHYRSDSFSSHLHPSNIFTLAAARKRAKLAGADPFIVDSLTFNEDANLAEWSSLSTVYEYRPEQFFWYHTDKIGLYDQMFPHIGIDDDNTESYVRPLYRLSERCPILTRREVEEIIPQILPYKTNNILAYLGAEADTHERKIAKLLPQDSHVYFERYQNGERNADVTTWASVYNRYREEMDKVRRRANEHFTQYCQVEGSVEYLPISAPLKAMLKHYQKHWANLPHLTRELELTDPTMDFFANSTMRQLLMFEKFGCLAQPIIAFKTEGLFSVYARRKGLLFNIILHGKYDTGKSYTLINFPTNWMFIEGTCKGEDGRTRAADKTDTHIEDLIRLGDEAPEWYVDPGVAKRHIDEVNEKKSALTSGIVTLKEFMFVAQPGMNRIRASRYVTTVQNYVEAVCTNKSVEARDALASRYHKIIMKFGGDRLEELKSVKVRDADIDNVKNYLKLNQFLECWVEKAALVGAICRDPFMGVFFDGSTRMLDYLRDIGVVSQKRGIRALEIMEPYGRHMVIKRAIHLTYDVPGGPLYKKKFHPAQFRHIEPFLYFTQNDLLFLWTLLSTEWIDVDAGNILKAACKRVDYDWESTKTPYQFYCEDVHQTLPFNRLKNFNWRRGNPDSSEYIVDLNYLELPGTVDEVASMLADDTDLQMSAKDAAGLLRRMCEDPFKPRIISSHSGVVRNGYAQVEEHEIAQHRMNRNDKIDLNCSDFGSVFLRFLNTLHANLIHRIYDRITDAPSDFNRFKVEYTSGHYANLKMTILFEVCDLRGTYQELHAEYSRLCTHSDVSELTNEEARRVVLNVGSGQSLLHYGVNEYDWYEQLRTNNLSYQDCRIILYGLEHEMIMEWNNPLRWYPAPREDIGFKNEDSIRTCAKKLVAETRTDSESDFKSIKVVKVITRGAHRRVCFSPMAIALFNPEVILDAFNFAVLSRFFKPGKRLLGWVCDDNLATLRTVNYTQEMIMEYVKQDEINNPDKEYSRRLHGIPVKRRNYEDNAVEEYLREVSFRPGGEVIDPNAGNVALPPATRKYVEIIQDFDEWAARHQHVLCGMSLDEPVRTPEYIRQKYIEAGGKLGKRDYPMDLNKIKRGLEEGIYKRNFAAGRNLNKQKNKMVLTASGTYNPLGSLAPTPSTALSVPRLSDNKRKRITPEEEFEQSLQESEKRLF